MDRNDLCRFTKRGINMTEQVGEAFDVDLLHHAQQKTRLAINTLAGKIVPGMRESEAREMAAEVLDSLGAERRWHPSLVRFGVNTLCTYLQPSKPNVVLGENDVFFIDLGAVWGGHEGDAGATFFVGSDPCHRELVEDIQEIWWLTAKYWRLTNATGRDIYQYAQSLSRQRGWELNMDIQGHRVSDYPHAAHGTPDLGAMYHPAAADRWILELQLRHPTRPFGAFYEDLLSHDIAR